jgi:hypothetical protein
MPNINLSPYTVEQQAIDRRRRMAELLQQQAAAPMEMPSMPGVRSSPFAGLAKLLQGYGAGQTLQNVDTEQKALGEKYQTERTNQFQNLARLLSAPAQAAQPAIEPTFTEGQSTITQGGQAAIPARPAGYLPAEALSQFTHPEIQQLAMSQALSQLAPKAPIKLGADESLLNPSTFETVATGKAKETYHPPVNEFDPNSGQTLKVAYSNLGTRKVIDTAGAYTPDQWNAIPAEAKAKLLFDQYKFGNLSAEQLIQAGQKNAQLGQELQKLQFETGKGGPGPVTIPANAPMPNLGNSAVNPAAPAPVVAPVVSATPLPFAAKSKKPYTQLNAPPATQVAPVEQPFATPTEQPPVGLSPKAQQQWFLDQAKIKTEADKAEQKKSRNLEQLPDLISSAKAILQGNGGVDANGKPIKTPLPTQSMGGAVVDVLGGFIGKTPSGAGPADRLKVIGGAMTMAMPRMEGPQSDADTRLYREMAGRVGDDTLSIQRRLDALDQVEKIYSKYGKSTGWKVVK